MCNQDITGDIVMNANESLLEEIMECVSKIPPECQERVLDVVKAMVYTREVVEREKENIVEREL